MIRLGFEDEEEKTSLEENGEEQKQHGDSFVKEKKLSVYIPEKRIPGILSRYDCVVVHDFGDGYHMSDKEKSEKNNNYEVFKNFSRCKHKYRKLDQYVIAMREMFKCLDYVAEKNGLYDPDKFRMMFIKGKINIFGLFMPKFVGKERKTIDSKYLTEFILSNEDPKNILRIRNEEVYTEEDCETFADKMFTEEELQYMSTPETEEEKRMNTMDFDPSEDDPFERNIVTELKGKKFKKILKNNPTIVQMIKDSKDITSSLSSLSRYAYSITSDDLDYIERYDKKHHFVSSSNVPKFEGDIMNRDDYNKYMNLLDEWADDNTFESYHGKTRSLGEIKELEIKELLESNGWDIRKLYGNKEKEKELKKQYKKDKKREKELRQKLVDIHNRRNRRMGETIEEYSKSSKKKSGKKGKKKMKKDMDKFFDSCANEDSLNWID